MTETTLKEQFDLHRRRTPGPAAVDRVRTEAFEAFAAHGFPTRREEAWRYTDLKPLATGTYALPSSAPDAASQQRAAALVVESAAAFGRAAAAAVLVDGRLDASLSRPIAADGLEVSSLASSWERAGRAPRRPRAGHALAELNTAFAADGVAITAAAGAAPDAPVHVFVAGSGRSNLALHPRIAIELGPNSALTVIVHCLDAGAPASWLNLVTNVAQAEGSRLALYRLQEHGSEVYHTSLLSAELAKDASLEVGYVDLGGRLIRNDLDVLLAEPGAAATLFGVFVARGRQHMDNHVRVDHAAAHTTSDEAFRGIADEHGRGVFNGKVIVRRGAQRIDARQASDNLLLSEHAEIDTRPELEIYADDVKCSHGATVGELDAEHLFYLRSRGIDADTARALLTFAFANRILRRLGPESLRERATQKVVGHLPDRNRWEISA